VDIPEGIWPLLADEAELETALINLVLNARDAMNGSGEVRITVENKVLDDGACQGALTLVTRCASNISSSNAVLRAFGIAGVRRRISKLVSNLVVPALLPS